MAVLCIVSCVFSGRRDIFGFVFTQPRNCLTLISLKYIFKFALEKHGYKQCLCQNKGFTADRFTICSTLTYNKTISNKLVQQSHPLPKAVVNISKISIRRKTVEFKMSSSTSWQGSILQASQQGEHSGPAAVACSIFG